MKIIQLEYFIKVVELNSFTKAAQVLHISQPSLTAAIKKLENELDYPLLNRTTKEIKITEKGILFYQYAAELVSHYQQTAEKMYDLKRSAEPKIRLSILESTAQWISSVIQQHHREYPDQSYQITEMMDHSQIIQRLISYDDQLALSNEAIHHADIESIRLYEEDYLLLVPPEEFEDDAISLQGLPLILPNKQYQVRKHLDDYFTRLNYRMNIVMEVDRFEAATYFVRNGMGYAVIPRVYYQSLNADYLSVIPISPSLSRSIYINYAKKRKHSERVLSLVRLCQNYWAIR